MGGGKKSRSFDLRSNRYHGIGHRRRLRNDLNEAKLQGLKTYVYDGDVIRQADTSDAFTKRDASKILSSIGSKSVSDLYQLGTPEYLLNQDVAQRFNLDPSLYSIDSYDDGSYATPSIPIGYDIINSIDAVTDARNGVLTGDSDGVLFMGDNAYGHRNMLMFDANAHIAKLQAEEARKKAEEARKKAEEARKKAEEEEEEFATKHSYGEPGRSIAVVTRTVTPMVKSRKTGKILSQGKPKISYSYADNKTESDIYEFWKKLGFSNDKGDTSLYSFASRITGLSKPKKSFLPYLTKNDGSVFKNMVNYYFRNKNGDIFFDNGEGLTIWNNGRARYKGRMMNFKDALTSYYNDLRAAEKEEEGDDDET